MNTDRLKEYIDGHRDQFDDLEAPNLDHLWTGITSEKKKTKSTHNRWIALVIVLAILIATLWYNFYQTNQKLNQLEQFVMSSPMYKVEHERLIKQVSEKEEEIASLNINEADYAELFSELQELEVNKEIFQKDFELYGDSRELMKTLFKNYERKTKILELLLFENEKKINHENIDRHEM